MFNEFRIDIAPRIAYDLDIPKGQEPHTNSGSDAADQSYGLRDLYFPSTGDKIQGVQQPVKSTNFNRVAVDPGDTPERCRSLSTDGGGNVPLDSVSIGSKICVHTHQGRWAMLTITRLPLAPSDTLGLDVIVLDA